MKYWIKPDIENRIKNGEIRAFLRTTCSGRLRPTRSWLKRRRPRGSARTILFSR